MFQIRQYQSENNIIKWHKSSSDCYISDDPVKLVVRELLINLLQYVLKSRSNESLHTRNEICVSSCIDLVPYPECEDPDVPLPLLVEQPAGRVLEIRG